ncbi:hypothetical protein IAE22_32845, partial [Bacillus sp. S34]|nr:hypothetical protein [Bacillus sp. S34]
LVLVAIARTKIRESDRFLHLKALRLAVRTNDVPTIERLQAERHVDLSDQRRLPLWVHGSAVGSDDLCDEGLELNTPAELGGVDLTVGLDYPPEVAGMELDERIVALPRPQRVH